MQVLAYKLMLNFLNFSSSSLSFFPSFLLSFVLAFFLAFFLSFFLSLFPHSPLFIRAEAEAEAPKCPSFVPAVSFTEPSSCFTEPSS